MTLKQKFDRVLDPRAWNISEITPQEQCEKIADEFAVDFAEWMHSNTIYNGSEFYLYIGDSQNYKLNKLLEIYKKEKGL